jgi:hypothetical protein
MASIKKRPNGQYRARYRDATGREHAKHFTRKVDAQDWLDQGTAAMVSGTYVDPRARKVTVGEWCDQWLLGYGSRRTSTVRQARTHINQIKKSDFGKLQLAAVRPSMIRSWLAGLRTASDPLAAPTCSRSTTGCRRS